MRVFIQSMEKKDEKSTAYSIRTELFLWFLLLSLLPLILFAWLSYQKGKEGLISAAELQLRQSASLTRSFVQNWFDYRVMDSINQAKDRRNMALLSSLEQGYKSSQLSLSEYIKTSDWEDRVASSNNELINFIENYDYIYDLFLIDKQGNILFTLAKESDLGSNLLSDAASNSGFAHSFLQSVSLGVSNFSDLEQYEPSGNRISGFLTTPIFENSGNIVGVFAIQLHFNRIFELMKKTSKNSVTNYLISADGSLRTPINNQAYQLLKDMEPQKLKYLQSVLAQSHSNQQMTDGTVSTYLNANRENVIGIGNLLKLPGVSWFLISEMKEQDALVFAVKLRDIVFLLVIASGVFIIVISIFPARRITKPITLLVEATKAVAEGKLDHQIEIKSSNEIGYLAKTFNKMVIKRRFYEYNLEQSHQKIAHTLEQLEEQKYVLDQHSVVAITDINGAITYVNDKFCRLSGYSREELLGSNHKVLRSGMHDKQFYQKMYQKITQGNVWKGEVCNRNKSGDLYWLDTTIVPFHGDSQQTQSYIAIRTDISERKKTEEALKISEERYALALSVANDGIWDLDLNANKVIFDERYYTLAGYAVNEFPHDLREWENRIHPDERQFVKQALNNYIDGKHKIYEIEFRFLRKDNSYMWILARGKIVATDDKEVPIRMVGTHSDISMRKHTEQALQRAQKMEAIGLLAGGIAHDFNNILGVIMGNLDLLTDQLQSNAKASRRILSAVRASERAARLTKQLLGFSRRKVTETKVTNINLLLDDMNEMLCHSLGHQLNLTQVYEKNLWLTEIDQGDFQDAILNLVLNARDAMKNDGEVILQTSNCVLDEAFCRINLGAVEGDYVQLALSDDGKGIPEDIQQNIFQPFFTTKSQGKGTGLGLSMVFGFVKRSNGYIQVYSEYGEGTTFKIFLPRSQDSVSAKLDSDKKIDDLIKKNKTISKVKATVLLVDDEEALVELAKDNLINAGYHVLTASNVAEALDIIHKKPTIDLLFSDVVMPGGKTGFELAENIALNYPKIKILLTSGYTGNVAANKGLISKEFRLLNKPYSQQQLITRIEELLTNGLVLKAESDEIDRTETETGASHQCCWLEGYNTGIKVIDDDHRYLLSILNDCHKLSPKEELATQIDAIKNLIQIIKIHFKRELLVMDYCGYPHSGNHKQNHHILLKQVNTELQALQNNTKGFSNVLVFLEQWIIEHIRSMDNELETYCKGKEEKLRELVADLCLKGNKRI